MTTLNLSNGLSINATDIDTALRIANVMDMASSEELDAIEVPEVEIDELYAIEVEIDYTEELDAIPVD